MIIQKEEQREKNIEDYKKFHTEEEWQELSNKIKAFKGKRVIHINATSKGGGVAEILKTLIPLEKSVGIDSHWYYLQDDLKLFEITKKLHNSLQGGAETLTQEEKDYYLEYNKELTKEVESLEPDVLIVHDPQPLAAIQFIQKDIPSIARIHIDMTNPNPDAKEFILPMLQQYDRVVFSLKDFVPPKLENDGVKISPPAIDPLSPKNEELSKNVARTILLASNIPPDKPIIAQISRFDKWKDPIGVIDAYYKAKTEVPLLQLILVGVMESKDDPEAVEIFKQVEKKAKGDPDIHLIYRPEQLQGNSMDVYVNAIQRSADVILQKSLREGFGLTVTEAMWKEKPVIGGDVGGIKLQIEDGKTGFLVSSPEEAAERIVKLFKDPEKTKELGKKAKEHVRQNFLITRFLSDDLDIMSEVLNEKEMVS